MRRVVLGWIGLALAAALAGAASAQDDSARAEALFRAGRQASARGDHATACMSYRESFRIENTVGTLLNIAVCEEALGQLTSAWQRYQRVLSALSRDDTRVALTRDRLAALELRLPQITVVLVAGERDTTRISLDSVEHPASSLAEPLRIDPGAHELKVFAAGHEARTYPFSITEGERHTLTVEPGALLPPPDALAVNGASAPVPFVARSPSAQRAPIDADSLQRTIGWTSLAVGGAGLAVSAVAFGFVIDRKLTVDDHCSNHVCDDTGEAAAESGRAFVRVSWISLAGGALATATGFYLLWTAPSEPRAISAAPFVDRNLLGARVQGTFE